MSIMSDSLETKIARIEERLALEVKGLNNAITEFRADMKTALNTLSVAIDQMGEKTRQTEKNKGLIDSLFQQKQALQEQIDLHRKEDADFHKEIRDMMTEHRVKNRIWAVIYSSVTGIVSSVLTAYIISKLL